MYKGSTQKLERANPHKAVGWSGRVRLGSGRDDWHSCRVIDISGGGAGVEIESDLRPEATGQTVTLVVELKGVVRDLKPRTAGGTRIGVQFDKPTGDAADPLLRLISARW